MAGKVDEVLIPDFHQLRECCLPFRALSPSFDGLLVELWWVPTHLQFADNLTKVRTPSSDAFFRALTQNGFNLPEFLRPRKAHQSISHLLGLFVTAFVLPDAG